MGIDYQLDRVSVDIAKGFRQLQKSDAEFARGNVVSSVNHLYEGQGFFVMAEDHAAKVEDDVYNKVGKEIDKGNHELQKYIDAYADGNDDNAEYHYANAMDDYDNALDLIV